jgi:chromosome segregation ATPase
LKTIEQGRMRVFEQLREGESELRNVQGENRALKVQREKNEQMLRQLEKEAETVGRQERQARDEWNGKIREVEKMLAERRDTNKQVIEQLGAVS